MPTSRLVLVGLASLALATGCSGELTGGPREAALILRTGEGCAGGCAMTRPLLVGTEEIAELVGSVGAGATVRVADPDVATAWIAPVRLCCDLDGGGTCHPLADADPVCPGSDTRAERVVIRALRPGRTTIELGDGRAWEPIEVADAMVVTAIERLVDPDAHDGDVVERPISAWIDGRVERLAIRAGTIAQLRFVAIDAEGRDLHATHGISMHLDDASIARVGLAYAACDGASADGELIAIAGAAQGSTTLSVRAGTAAGAIAIDVTASCDDEGTIVLSHDGCETDADCAPVECCHASACGAASAAPVCDEALCTTECRAGTIDCGGGCLCLAGQCAAYLAPVRDPTCPAAPVAVPKGF